MNSIKNKHYLTKYSLRFWVLFLALAPTILIGILLGTYFTINRFSELENELIDKGINIIEPLAIATSSELIKNSPQSTQLLLTQIQLSQSPLIKSIIIFDAKNKLFSTSHVDAKNIEIMRFKKPISMLKSTLVIQQESDVLIAMTPIFSTSSARSFNNPQHIDEEPIGYISLMLNKEQAVVKQYRSALFSFLVVIIGMQINLFFTFRLVNNVTKPISDMVKAIEKIRKGKLDTRLYGNLIGELDILRKGINAMASSLSEYHEEMQQNIDQATFELRETLEQIEIQNVELDLAKKRALEASRIKSEFLTNMSHELRTPLNGVIGFARQLLKTPLQASQLEYILTIERSATNLLSIINDILDFSKLEAGKMVLESIPFSLRENISDTLTLLSNAANKDNIELVVDIQPDIPDNVQGDAMRFGQIITNLIGNSLKFTEKGSIMLKITADNVEAESILLKCEVTDTGIGIEKSRQDVIFKAFEQVDSSISRRFGGTGLGLIITKRLINQMGGIIGLSSEEGKGSTFWFTLPLSLSQLETSNSLPIETLIDKSVLIYEPKFLTRTVINQQLNYWSMKTNCISSIAALKSALAAMDSPLSISKYDYIIMSCYGFEDNNQLQLMLKLARSHTKILIGLFNSNDQQLLENLIRPEVDFVLNIPVNQLTLARNMVYPPIQHDNVADNALPKFPASSSNEIRYPITVLIVDDNPANLKLLNALLEDLVTKVIMASDGDQAVAIANEQVFDIILMDIQMPRTDGITATKLIRQGDTNKSTPIIAVTAHILNEERKRILGSGMDGYLAKPIDEAALKETIDHWVADRRLADINLETLNWERCLAQANHKPALALDMISLLKESIPQTVEQIETALTEQDSEQMLATVHKLHGACCYCGAPTLQKLCNHIETNLKKDAPLNAIEPELLELLDELIKVESAISQILKQLSTDK